MLVIGSITFGAGLGDWFYVIVMSIIILCLSAFYFFIRKVNFIPKKIASFLIVTTCFLMMAYTVYEFTLGRDSEYPWNGCITFRCNR